MMLEKKYGNRDMLCGFCYVMLFQRSVLTYLRAVCCSSLYSCSCGLDWVDLDCIM